jgi:alpha-N-arabinofuranosidase
VASGEVVVFTVNRSTEESLPLTLDLDGFGELKLVEALTYTNDDPYWQASPEDDAGVSPAANDSVALAEGRLTAQLPAVSWSMVRLAKI